MADLSPDLSPYKSIAAEGQANQLSLPQLLSLTQASRALTTQSAISDAMRANPNDPQAAMRQAIAAPGSFMGPEDISRFTQASEAQFHLKQQYFNEAATAISSLFTKPHPTLEDWHWIAPKLSWMMGGGPEVQGLLHSMETTADPRTGELNKDRLAQLDNYLHLNAGFTQRTIKTPEGTQSSPAGAASYGQQPGGQSPSPSPTPQPRSPTGAGPASPQVPQGNDTAQQSMDAVKKQYPSYGIGGGASTEPSDAQYQHFQDSTRQYGAALGQNYQASVIPMQKSIELMLKNGPNFTGRGTTEFNNIKNFLHTVGVIPNDKMDETVDFESMKKYMEQFINNNSAGGTDARLWQSIAGSPSPDKLQKTNLNLTRVMLGLQRMQQVGLDEYRRIGGRPEFYQDWYNDWAKRQDPMAFVWDTMTKEEQQAYGASHWKGQKKGSPEMQRFEDSLNAGQRSAGVMGSQ